MQQNPLWNQSEVAYYQSCCRIQSEPIRSHYYQSWSRIHSGTNQKSSTINLAAESTLEPIRSLLLLILQQNPLWNQSEVFYYQSCSRIHFGTNQKSSTIYLSTDSMLWDQSETVYYQSCNRIHLGTNQKSSTIHLSTLQRIHPGTNQKSSTINHAAVSNLEPFRSRYYQSCSRIHSGTNRKKPSTIYLAAESTRKLIRSRLLSILEPNLLRNQSEVGYY